MVKGRRRRRRSSRGRRSEAPEPSNLLSDLSVAVSKEEWGDEGVEKGEEVEEEW